MGGNLELEVKFQAAEGVRHPRFGYVIQTASGDRLLNSNNRYQKAAAFDVPQSSGILTCRLGVPPFLPGRYVMSLYLGDLGPHDHHVELEGLSFEVLERDLWGLGRLPPHTSLMWWPSEFGLRAPDAA